MNARVMPVAGGARLRHMTFVGLLLCALAAHGAPSSKAHDNVQTRADCAFAASRALGSQALVFADPPQASPPRATDLAGEYYWHGVLIGQDGARTPVWLHCEIIPGSTATYAEVLLREGAAP